MKCEEEDFHSRKFIRKKLSKNKNTQNNTENKTDRLCPGESASNEADFRMVQIVGFPDF